MKRIVAATAGLSLLYALAIVKGVTQPETRQRLANIGAEVVARTPAEFGRFIKSELQEWSASSRNRAPARINAMI